MQICLCAIICNREYFSFAQLMVDTGTDEKVGVWCQCLNNWIILPIYWPVLIRGLVLSRNQTSCQFPTSSGYFRTMTRPAWSSGRTSSSRSASSLLLWSWPSRHRWRKLARFWPKLGFPKPSLELVCKQNSIVNFYLGLAAFEMRLRVQNRLARCHCIRRSL